MDALLFSPVQLRGVGLRNRIILSPMLQYAATGGYVNDWHLVHYPKFAAGSADLVALGREFLHNPNWPLDAAQKLRIASPFAQVSRSYGYSLEKRARNPGIRPSTWQRGIRLRPDEDGR